ncbi:MAG: hypothetical protein WC761_04755 [Candidatus Paceibacterota bacterium]|jgi:hypothetical protein
MITYFSNKKKFFATFILAWTLFLNIAPGVALAYQTYVINGQTYWVFGSTEQGNTAPGIQSVFLQPGQSFDSGTANVVDTQTGAVINSYQSQADQDTSNGFEDTGDGVFYGPGGTEYALNSEGQLVEIPNAEAAIDAGDTTGTQGIPPGEAGEAQLGTGDLAQNSVAALGTCSIGAILGRLLSALIGQLISTITGFLKTGVSEVAMQVADCATRFLQICGFSPNQANQNARLVQKSVGGSSPAPSGLLGGLIPGDISFDSIMFCIINEIITYITLSTIQWINSGFDGNPVFIQNPGALFQRIAAQEAGNFIYTAANGVQQAATAGVHQTLGTVANQGYALTGAMRQGVTRGLVGYYNNYSNANGLYDMYNPPQPTLTSSQYSNRNFQGFGVSAQRYNPVNNPWARVAFYEGPAMTAQMQRQQQIASLRYQTQGGYYDNTACPPGQERAYDMSCKPGALLTTSQGGQVRDEFNARNMTKYIRTATANSFDAIITALVNQLMKVAINKMFEAEQKVNGEIQGALQR